MGNKPRGGAGLSALLALTLLAAAGCKPGSSTNAARYHALRFWGVKTRAPIEVVDSALDRAADRHNIPRKLLQAVAHVESRKNPDAVSRVGATGILQVMPANSRHCGLLGSHQLKDVLFNTACGAQILSENLRMFGDEKLALMGFNWGSGNVQKWIKAGRPAAMVPSETRKYVPLVLAMAHRG